MLDTYEKFRLTNKTGRTDQDNLFAEVNWSDKEEIQGCKVIKFTLGDKTAIIDRNELNAMLFTIGTSQDQQKMIPQIIRRSKWYETIIGVKAKKDICKGEEIRFPLKITLPSIEEEAIAEIKQQKSEVLLKIPKVDK